MALSISNGQLLLDGDPCNHVGVNAAYLLARRWYTDTDTQHIETLTNLAGMGVRVIRCTAIPNAPGTGGGLTTWGTATGLSAAFYTAQDVIFNYAESVGIKIIPTLFANYWAIANYKSEKLNQLGVSGSAMRTYMRTCAAEYVAHYASHGAIAGWEIGNEWNNYAELSAYPTGNDYTGSAYSADANNLITIPNLIEAYIDIANTIKSNYTNPIILSGNAGPWFTDKYADQGYINRLKRLNPDPINTISLHAYSYPTNNIWMRQGMEPLADIIGFAKKAGASVGKPVILGEVGISSTLSTREKDFKILSETLQSSKKPPLTLLWNYYKPNSSLPDNSSYDFYTNGPGQEYVELIQKANKVAGSGAIHSSAATPKGFVNFTGTQCFTTPMPTFNSSFTLSYWVRYAGSRNDNFPRIFSATSDESTNGFVVLDLASSSSAVDYSENYFRNFAGASGQSATLRGGHTYQNTWKNKTFVYKYWTSTFTASASTDTLTLASGNIDIQTGDMVRLTTTGTLPAGVTTATDYYVIKTDNNLIKLASGQGNSYLETAIDLTDAGSGTHTITCRSLAVYDNGLKSTGDSTTTLTLDWTTPSSGNFVIGANRNANGDFFKGQLSTIRLWQKGLTELEVWKNYTGNPLPGYTGYLENGISNLTAVGSPTWTTLGTRTTSTRTNTTRTVSTERLVNSQRGVAG